MRARAKPSQNRHGAGPNAPAELPGLCAATAAAACRVQLRDIVSVRRSEAPIARARQFAAYLQHVVFGTGYSACGRLFDRDRTTIRHACARIEDARDDPVFDEAALRLEASLHAQREMFLDLIEAFTTNYEGDSSCVNMPEQTTLARRARNAGCSRR